MAERIKDAEDRLLESLFEAEPLTDAGFSVRVVRKLNRRLWLRRLMIPAAAVIGGAIAFKPMSGVAAALANLSVLIPQDAINAATSSIPQLQTVVMGAILLAVGLLGARMFEE
jgi:hypothetical protein